MKVNELLHSLVLQGHKLPLNLHPPLQAEYYSKSKKEYKLVGEMDLFHFINAFILLCASSFDIEEFIIFWI